MAKIKIDKHRCKGCKLCMMYCPLSEIELSKDLNKKGMHYAVFKNEGKCSGCCICAKVCPDVAIEVFRQKSEDRSQMSEVRGQRTEGRKRSNVK